jgi:multiple sugar transport system permease protein
VTRDRGLARALVAPALVLLAAVAGVPLLAVVWLAFRRRLPIFGIDEFTGLANFRALLADARFWNALGNTAYFTAVSVALELGLGLAIALGLRRAFPGRGLLRALVVLPWAVPSVVSAKIWAWLLTPEIGAVDVLLGRPDIDWLGTPALALHAAILVDVWKTTPFVALLLLAGLEAIPPDLYRAAKADGAGPARTLFAVTLPLLRPTLRVVLLFRALDAFRVFDTVFVLTGGGPADTTETLSIYAYRTLFRELAFGYGSAVALATFACTAAVGALAVAALGREPA